MPNACLRCTIQVKMYDANQKVWYMFKYMMYVKTYDIYFSMQWMSGYGMHVKISQCTYVGYVWYKLAW